MNALQNCKNPRCLSKKTVRKVFTIEYYSKSSESTNMQGEIIKQKEYECHKDLAIFYICEKCGYMADFKDNDLRCIGNYWLFIVPESDEPLLQKTRSKGIKGCIYCGSRKYPPRYIKNHVTKDAIIKLFVSPNREYLGYHCRVCRRTYVIQPENIIWENLQSNLKDTEMVNVLDQQHIYFNKKELQVLHFYDKDGEKIFDVYFGTPEGLTFYDKDKGIMMWEVPFRKIGGDNPTEDGAPIDDPNIEYHTIGFPRRKAKRLINFLANRGCMLDFQ